MKHPKQLTTAACIGVSSLALVLLAACDTTASSSTKEVMSEVEKVAMTKKDNPNKDNQHTEATISKPEGAMGSGKSKPGQAKNNQFWWPEQLDLSILHQDTRLSSPMDEEFDYASAFAAIE